MFDLKNLKSAIQQLVEERGLPHERAIDAVETALSAAYKKQYAKPEQIIRAQFNETTGDTEFFQVRQVVDSTTSLNSAEDRTDEEDTRTLFDGERHIWLEDAKKLQSEVATGDEIRFPLPQKETFGRIAAQTAKQAILHKLRESEKEAVIAEFSEKEGNIIIGHMQRFERGNIYVDLGRTVAILPFAEQIRGERFRQGERIRAIVLRVDQQARRGSFITLSRAHPNFVAKLLEQESTELATKIVSIKKIVREPGMRTKIAVETSDDSIDPVGALVGQRGVRVLTVMSELHKERIDVIEYQDDPAVFVEEALSPAPILSVEIDEENKKAIVKIAEDEVALAIGRGAQNFRLASQLTGYEIELITNNGDRAARTDGEEVQILNSNLFQLRNDRRDGEGKGEKEESDKDAGKKEKQDVVKDTKPKKDTGTESEDTNNTKDSAEENTEEKAEDDKAESKSESEEESKSKSKEEGESEKVDADKKEAPKKKATSKKKDKKEAPKKKATSKKKEEKETPEQIEETEDKAEDETAKDDQKG